MAAKKTPSRHQHGLPRLRRAGPTPDGTTNARQRLHRPLQPPTNPQDASHAPATRQGLAHKPETRPCPSGPEPDLSAVPLPSVSKRVAHAAGTRERNTLHSDGVDSATQSQPAPTPILDCQENNDWPTPLRGRAGRSPRRPTALRLPQSGCPRRAGTQRQLPPFSLSSRSYSGQCISQAEA